jgi:2'-5' RNA ligase
MPRLFTGLEIPQGLSLYLSGLRGGLYGARWIEPDNFHITLRFIGDIDARTAREIEYELSEIMRDPVEISVTGLSVFGGDKPHAVIANIAPSRQLTELQAEQERIMRRLGLPKDPRKFTPHITLARLRNATVLDVADYLSTRDAFRKQDFTAKNFVLFSARPSTGGGPYIIEASYPLGEPDGEEQHRLMDYVTVR